MARYECPDCGTVSEGRRWNQETREYFGYSVIIQDEFRSNYKYKCPRCHHVVGGDFIQKVDDEGNGG